MKILALEPSAKSVSCAVVEDGAPLASAYQCTGLTHSRTLLPMVDAMLKNADLTIETIDAIAIAAGPGSRHFDARGDGGKHRALERARRWRDGRAPRAGLQRCL